jgi:tetratricopeptide (TPR) repeat protein
LQNQYFRLILIAMGLWMASGCSTTNHAPIHAMVYHDLTGHYNAYFNTKEKFKTVMTSIDKAHKDDFKQVIPLFSYNDPKECGSYGGDLEDIEKRCTESIQLHKVSNYADDHFLLMGKARYIKGDYDKAQTFFKYITTEYKNGVDYVRERKKENKAARPNYKKKPAKKPRFKQQMDDKGNLVLVQIDDRPKYSPWIHEPARAEALVWLAKTYTANKQYTEASAVIQYAHSDPKFYKNLDKIVQSTEADNLLRQKNYTDAILPLEVYLHMTKKKKERVRPLFVLAQIYELNKNYARSAEYYKSVLKSRPNYDMEFYAKIRRANLGRKSGGSSSEIRHLLANMSHDGKYKDYFDQIYYELGEISLTENNRADARKYFRKSINTSTKNMDQKALSFYRLASMDYEEELYVSSKYNFDSTLTALAVDDTLQPFVKQRDKVLANLVTQINTIYREDSLQRIAKMSPADRKRFIRKLVNEQDKIAAEKETLKVWGLKQTAPDIAKGPADILAPNLGGDETSVWYFYNTNLRSNGYGEFQKKWGRRKLEDNWRRKDKSAAATSDTPDSDTTKNKKTDQENADNLPVGDKEQKLMADVPLTADAMTKSSDNLVNAYYLMGAIYKDDLQNYRKAIVTFEELNKRFDKHRFLLESYYQLYLLHTKLKNNAKAETYRGQILAEFPNSTIAKYLQDPKYLDEAKNKDNALYTYYASAFSDYSHAQYASAARKCVDADGQFKENPLKPKFDLLIAMIQGKENRLDEYIQSLNKVITKYPTSPEKDLAQQLLTSLNKSKLPQVDRSKHPDDSTFVMPVYTPTIDTSTKATIPTTTKTEPPVPGVSIRDMPRRDIAPTTPKDTTVKNTIDSTAKTYKPLSRTERMDSIMRAEHTTKNKPTTPTPSTTDKPATDSAVKTRKPLSRTERIDSIMRAEKAAKNKPATPTPSIIDKPTTDSTVKARKPLSRTERIDSIMRVEKATKNKSTTTNNPKIANPTNPTDEGSTNPSTHTTSPIDSPAKTQIVKPKVKLSAKDSLALKNKSKISPKDSTKTLLKPSTPKAAKDTIKPIVKPAAPKAVKDTIKPIVKPAAPKAAKDTIKPIVKPAAPKAAKDTIKPIVKPAAPKAAKDTIKPIVKPAAPKAAKDTIKPIVKPAAPKAAKDTIKPIVKPATPKATKDTIKPIVKPAAPKAAKDTIKPLLKPAAPKAAKDTIKPITRDTIKAQITQVKPTFDTDTTEELYGLSDESPHSVVVYFMDPTAFDNAQANRIDSANTLLHTGDKLTTRGVYVDANHKLIIIKSFKNKTEAMTYAMALQSKLNTLLRTTDTAAYFCGAISTINYSTLLTTQKINNYRSFYREYYK